VTSADPRSARPTLDEITAWTAVAEIKDLPFKPDRENNNDPSATPLFQATLELLLAAVDRGCDLDMTLHLLAMDVESIRRRHRAT
jgi:hypothetical protein